MSATININGVEFELVRCGLDTWSLTAPEEYQADDLEWPTDEQISAAANGEQLTVCDAGDDLQRAEAIVKRSGGAYLSEEAAEEMLTLCERDEAGRHFTEVANYLDELEEAGQIKVDRPVHDATGIPYSEEYWQLEITPAGIATAEWYQSSYSYS